MKTGYMVVFCVVCFLVGWNLPYPKDANAQRPKDGYTFLTRDNVSGMWVQAPSGDNPIVAVYSHDLAVPTANLAFYRSEKRNGADFAIRADKDEVVFQVCDKDGNFKQVPVTALLKLLDK